jgi:hypothetical protein
MPAAAPLLPRHPDRASGFISSRAPMSPAARSMLKQVQQDEAR